MTPPTAITSPHPNQTQRHLHTPRLLEQHPLSIRGGRKYAYNVQHKRSAYNLGDGTDNLSITTSVQDSTG